MKLGIRDLIGSVLLAAVIVPYAGYLAFGGMPFIQDPRGMAATGLVLGLAAMFAGNWLQIAPARAMSTAMVLLSVIVFGLGLVAVAAETSEVLLGIFIAALAAFWALATLYHAGVIAASPAGPAAA